MFFKAKKSSYTAKSGGMASFLGFKNVRSLMGLAGGEKFGVIEVAPEFSAAIFPATPGRRKVEPTPVLTAALRLSGAALNRWLADEREDNDFFIRLCEALPSDSPVQFLLRRRIGQLGTHYALRQPHVLNRIADEEVAHFFLQDYLESLIYPIEDFGIGSIWGGLFISGRSDEELTDKMARLLATLPCDATPCSAAELSLLLLDYYAPTIAEDDETEKPDTLYAEWLAEIPYEIRPELSYNGQLSGYWRLSAPPLRTETGWTRRLLENEALSASEFDIAVHIAPASQENTMREVLTRRLEGLRAQLEQAQDELEIADLTAQCHEIESRLQRYFEVGITLSIRADLEKFDEECGYFEEQLLSCGLAAHRTNTLDQTQDGMLDCAPLNLSRSDRPLVLPTLDAGRLAHIVVCGQPLLSEESPLAGLNRLGEPVYLNPAAKPGQTAFFLLGERDKPGTSQAGCLVRYLAAMRWLQGQAVQGFDRTGEWVRLVQQLGGQYISFGPAERRYTFNPLEITTDSLNEIGKLEGWVGEMTGFLAGILHLNEDLQEDLRVVLIEAAISRANRNEELNAAGLWIRAESSGYAALSRKLRELGQNGQLGWLFSQPTRLPAPHKLGELVFFSLAPEILSDWPEQAQKYYWSRLFARWGAQTGANPPTQPFLLVVSQAQEFLPDLAAVRVLSWLSHNAEKLRLSLWLSTPRADEWLGSYLGRAAFEKAQTHVFFAQNGVGLAGTARRFNLSSRFLKYVRELLPGAAVVRELDEDNEPLLYEFDPLPGDYIARIAAAPSQFKAPATMAITIRKAEKPVEVPLFAADELWNDTELESLQATPAPVIVEAEVEADNNNFAF